MALPSWPLGTLTVQLSRNTASMLLPSGSSTKAGVRPLSWRPICAPLRNSRTVNRARRHPGRFPQFAGEQTRLHRDIRARRRRLRDWDGGVR